ncbi:MAG: hypothetical protein C5B51_21770 [Terriglobia bacterium]|nr:MAG: hypothetical protein C5B51_21770 [Terriglobia bacterium]
MTEGASDSRLFLPATLVSQDGGGRDHEIVIPFNSLVNLIVFSPQFQLSNSGLALPKVSSTKLPPMAASGGQPPTITLQVSGRNIP